MGRQTQTRDRLVETAAELFWNQGYAQTGVSSIMKQARATSGSFYHFFPTKEDLLVAVLDLVSDQLESEVLGPAEVDTDDPAERIERVIEAYARSAETAGSRLCLPLGNLVSELGSSHEVARRRTNELMEGLVARIGDWLVDGPGRSSRQFDRRGLATGVVAILEGTAVMAMAQRNREPVDTGAEQIRLLLGVLVDSGRDPGEDMPLPASREGEARDWKAW